jgi:hypothetical protein
MNSKDNRAKAHSDAHEVRFRNYAVIDLAVAKQLRTALTEKRIPAAEPLFSWSFDKKLLEVGPWLVRLSAAPEVERVLAEYGEDVPWGYYVSSSVDLLTLRKSLRRYNLVQITGMPGEVLFRYWDPRVMATFLKIATEFQNGRLFEWIDHIEVAGEKYFGDLEKGHST